ATKRSPHPVSGGKRPGRDRVGSRPRPHPSPDDHGVPLLRRTAEPFFSHDGKPGAEGGSHRPSFDPRMVSSSGSEPHRPNGPPAAPGGHDPPRPLPGEAAPEKIPGNRRPRLCAGDHGPFILSPAPRPAAPPP